MSDDGGVWVKVYGTPTPDPELPGIGGWGEITGVTGTGTKYEYSENGLDWSVFEWSTDGTFTTSAGLVETLIVSGGMAHPYMMTGNAPQAFMACGDYTYTIELGLTSSTSNSWVSSSDVLLDGEIVLRSGFNSQGNGTAGRDPDGIHSNITGTDVVYARATDSVGNTSPPGWGGKSGVATPGAFIARVPKENDSTGLPAGPFDTTTAREKEEFAARNKEAMQEDEV